MNSTIKSLRQKSCVRTQRLLAGALWIKEYTGKNIIKGYAKHFAVDKRCAIKELEMLGAAFEPEHKAQVINAHNRMVESRNKRKYPLRQTYMDDIERDGHFAFIAGYTSGGTPYGITWEEEEENYRNELQIMNSLLLADSFTNADFDFL